MLIEVENVSYSLTDGSKRTNLILSGLNFSVQPEDRFAILGPSGSGKSTLLRLLNRLQDPTSGRILMDGRDTREVDVVDLRRRCAMVLQQAVSLPGSVEENLLLGPTLRKGDIERARDRIPGLMERVRLAPELRNRPAGDLSIGQMHRVALARALMNDPEVLLLDEPTAALDPGTASAILDLVVDLNRDLSLTVVIVTHNFQDARKFATSGAIIIDGRISAFGGTEVLERSDDPAVAAFLRGD